MHPQGSGRDLARGLRDPGLNQSSSESYRRADKRDDKFIAHTDGFQLMKIMDVENDALTNAKQQGHTNPSRLKTN